MLFYISGANDGQIFLCRILLPTPMTYEFFFGAFHFSRHRRAGLSPPVFYSSSFFIGISGQLTVLSANSDKLRICRYRQFPITDTDIGTGLIIRQCLADQPDNCPTFTQVFLSLQTQPTYFLPPRYRQFSQMKRINTDTE